MSLAEIGRFGSVELMFCDPRLKSSVGSGIDRLNHKLTVKNLYYKTVVRSRKLHEGKINYSQKNKEMKWHNLAYYMGFYACVLSNLYGMVETFIQPKRCP